MMSRYGQPPFARPTPRNRAVVLGASMAGLLAARVLSDTFTTVTIIERDDLSVPGDRPGVPQGRHVHALLARGQQVFEELFPGITAELLSDGAIRCRSMSELRMSIYGHTLHRSDAGYSLLQASRPLLEWRVRERVRSLPNVELIDRCHARSLLTDRTGNRVTGVRVEFDSAVAQDIPADLTVSCLGRHGPIDTWLDDLGYEPPVAEGVRIDMKYASRYVRLGEGAVRGDKEIVIANRSPARGLALFAVEDGRHILTLIGYGADHPPHDEEGFWRFAASVAPRDVWTSLLDAEPLTEIATYRYLANQRRRYENLAVFPQGLLVFGDAVCSFSPAFGQGMSMSALQAVELRRVLAGGDRDLAGRYFRAAATAIDDAWVMTKVFDLAMPHVRTHSGQRIPGLGVLVHIAMAVGEREQAVGQQMSRIAGLLDRPFAALRPTLLARAAAAVGGLGLDRARAELSELRSAPEGSIAAFDPLPCTRVRDVHRLRVRSVERDTPGSVLIEFDVPTGLLPRYRFSAGQHVVVHGTHDGRPIRRSYSLCDAAGSGRLRIGVRRRPGGAFSGYAVDHLVAGTYLYVSEPAGVFTPPFARTERAYCAVAAGSGITPIVSIIATTLESEPASTFVLHYGSRDAGHIMLAAELASLTERFADRLRIVHYLSRQSPGPLPRGAAGTEYRRGRIVVDDLHGVDADLWLLCGPRGLVAEASRSLTERGVDRSGILIELFETREISVLPAETAARCRVVLTGHGDALSFDMPQGTPILDAALNQREDLPYSCLGGSCGTCLALVERGKVEMDPDPLLAITPDEINAGYVLTCRARPVSDEVALRFGR
ncbi:2Fe-2S iron-sulfur cluster binding domain-containing protein [Nocardia nova]|uniref:2Fe-2S iron-sulfur cluster-binding protein n=1 Tax=Nocardia nova TaxID=37330 RepID=UPI0025AF193D|nr:2Fe-2S iron-sulfur cluster-binding protein [Nocardia nova]MDN2495190.1 2Fe-2S iron-sulfur cluster binding domain-containing protein [Nocardia nova]